MGLFDNIRDAAQNLQAQQMEQFSAQVDAELPPDAPRSRVDVVSTSGAGLPGPQLMVRYVGIVGLQPEDVYAIWPDVGSTGHAYTYNVMYRDRPEYEAGRARWAAAVGAA